MTRFTVYTPARRPPPAKPAGSVSAERQADKGRGHEGDGHNGGCEEGQADGRLLPGSSAVSAKRRKPRMDSRSPRRQGRQTRARQGLQRGSLRAEAAHNLVGARAESVQQVVRP